jgi:hypothetical protein
LIIPLVKALRSLIAAHVLLKRIGDWQDGRSAVSDPQKAAFEIARSFRRTVYPNILKVWSKQTTTDNSFSV